MANYELAGPAGFFRNTYVVQETNDTWPVVYVWKGESDSAKAPIRRWIFKRDMCEEQTLWWESDPIADYPAKHLTYAEWWAFIYFMATNHDKLNEGTVALEERFYREVLLPGKTYREGEQS